MRGAGYRKLIIERERARPSREIESRETGSRTTGPPFLPRQMNIPRGNEPRPREGARERKRRAQNASRRSVIRRDRAIRHADTLRAGWITGGGRLLREAARLLGSPPAPLLLSPGRVFSGGLFYHRENFLLARYCYYYIAIFLGLSAGAAGLSITFRVVMRPFFAAA